MPGFLKLILSAKCVCVHVSSSEAIKFNNYSCLIYNWLNKL